MENKRFRCAHCRKLHSVRVEGQKYCGSQACQRARKKRWRRQKYSEDADYRLNQKQSTQAWLESQGGPAEYYRRYRKRRRSEEGASPEQRLASGVEGEIASLFVPVSSESDASANRDAFLGESPIKTGRYKMWPASANRDAILVEISVITGT